jgi:predicted small lipoprotein YifL
MRILRSAVAALALVSLAGCGILLPTAKDRAAKKSPNFRSGYSDGCASATTQDTNHRAEQVRDESLYKSDSRYRSGWASGFANCRTTTNRPANTPAAGPIPDNQPGGHPN